VFGEGYGFPQLLKFFSACKRVTRAGLQSKIYFEPKQVMVAIVTCGGLCPGLNDVVSKVIGSFQNNELNTHENQEVLF
jgi:predicted metal-binding protein